MQKAASIAVVGGGLGGLSCCVKLLELLPNARATVFDMGRSGPGGRASTRRRDGHQFDHGCQFARIDTSAAGNATARADLSSQMQIWDRSGSIARWPDSRIGLLDATSRRFAARQSAASQWAGNVSGGFCNVLAPGELCVGAPSMDALCSSLAAQQPERLLHSWGTRHGRTVQHPGRLSHLWDTQLRSHDLSRAFSTYSQLFENLTRALSRQVTSVEGRSGGGWTLCGTTQQGADAHELGGFDAIILSDAMMGRSGSPGYIQSGSAPVQQLLTKLQEAKAQPRLTLMASFPAGSVSAPFDAAAVRGNEAIEWISHDSAKPGRSSADGSQHWVAVSTERFAQHAIDQRLPLQLDGRFQDPDTAQLATVTSEMLLHLAALLAPFAADANALQQPLHAAAQRWGSALYPVSPEDPSRLLLASEDGLAAVTGDWVAGSEVQRVVVHAHATARALAERLSQ